MHRQRLDGAMILGMGAVEIVNLHKTYRRRRGGPTRAVDGLDLVVDEGGVHGFLGPNGSGKTTTIRMLLGLVRPDSGSLSVLGLPVPQSLPQLAPQIGALVETPLFFPNFSGRTNLRLLGDLAGVGVARQEECLELVGLRDRADDRFKAYSLGMKQRLGIAAALLKQPRLLILDEPSNGLDPAGIREVRELIRALGADGRTTVLLSSHLLAEVQQVCDHVSILARGRCVASGPVDAVLATRSHDDVLVELDPGDQVRGTAVLTDAGLRCDPSPGGLVVHDVGDPARVTRILADAGLYLRGLAPVAADLESVFLELTADHASDPAEEVA